MSHLVRTSKASGAETDAVWSVLSDEGDPSGPFDMDALKRKAAEGTLTAACQVKSGDSEWMRAADLRELEMDWLVLISQEEVLGPFAFTALEVLRSAGHIPADAHVFRRQTSPVSGSQGMQLVQRTLSAEAQRREVETANKRLEADLEAKDLEFDAERQQHASEASLLRAEALRRDAEITALKAEIRQLAEDLEGRNALEGKLVDGERENSRLKSELAEMEKRMAALHNDRGSELEETREKMRLLEEKLQSTEARLEETRVSLVERNKKLQAWAHEFEALASGVEAQVQVAEEDPPVVEAVAEEKPLSPDGTRRVRKSGSASKAGVRRISPVSSGTKTLTVSEDEVEVIPPDPDAEKSRIGFAVPSGSERKSKLAALEAQAQQELARLQVSKGRAPLWSRKNSST